MPARYIICIGPFIAPLFDYIYIQNGHHNHFWNRGKDKPRDRPPELKIKLKIQKENIKIEPDTKREKYCFTHITQHVQ